MHVGNIARYPIVKMTMIMKIITKSTADAEKTADRMPVITAITILCHQRMTFAIFVNANKMVT